MRPLSADDKLTGAALVAAPGALLGAGGIYAVAGSYLASSWGGTAQVVAFALMAVALGGLSRLAESGWAVMLGPLTTIGSVAGAAIGVERIYTGQGFPLVGGIDGGVLLYGLGVLFPVSLVGLASRLRLGQLSWAYPWSWASLAFGGILFPASRIGDLTLLGLGADLAIAAGLIPIGLRLLQDPRSTRPFGPVPSG